MTLGRLYFVYICSSRSCQRLQNTLQKQRTVCAAFADDDMSFLERLSDRYLFPWFFTFFLFFGFVQLLATDSELKPTISEDD